MLTVKLSITSKLAKIREKLTGAPMKALMKVTGTDIVANVRREVVTQGKPGGGFAQLSGFNQGSKGAARERNRQRKIGLLDDNGSKRTRDQSLAKTGSKHAGYAAQKERDHEAGKIPYGAAERWRRTGGLVAALVGVIFMTPTSARVELHAGEVGSDEDKKLTALALGTPNMPARNPTLRMEPVESRFMERLKKLLGGL